MPLKFRIPWLRILLGSSVVMIFWLLGLFFIDEAPGDRSDLVYLSPTAKPSLNAAVMIEAAPLGDPNLTAYIAIKRARSCDPMSAKFIEETDGFLKIHGAELSQAHAMLQADAYLKDVRPFDDISIMLLSWPSAVRILTLEADLATMKGQPEMALKELDALEACILGSAPWIDSHSTVLAWAEMRQLSTQSRRLALMHSQDPIYWKAYLQRPDSDSLVRQLARQYLMNIPQKTEQKLQSFSDESAKSFLSWKLVCFRWCVKPQATLNLQARVVRQALTIPEAKTWQAQKALLEAIEKDCQRPAEGWKKILRPNGVGQCFVIQVPALSPTDF